MPHYWEYRVCDRRSGENRNRWVHATNMAQGSCHGIAGPIGKINRCASHASAYVQQDMDSGVNALLLRFFLKNTSIADLQTVQRIGVQCAPATNTASPLCLCLQKALKASAQGNAGLKGLQFIFCWQRGCMPGAFHGHGQCVTSGFCAAIGKLNRHDFAELLGEILRLCMKQGLKR